MPINYSSKKTLIAIIVFFIIIFLFVYLYYMMLSVPLDVISLKLDDLKDEGYMEFDREYITEPYIASNSTLFAGWNILEKYHVRFSKNDSCFIVIDIGRLESEDKSREFLSVIRNTSFYGYDFTDVEYEVIGEESYIGEDIAIVSGSRVTLYFIVFRVENVVVAFLSSGHSLEDSIYYSKVMENNLIESLK